MTKVLPPGEGAPPAGSGVASKSRILTYWASWGSLERVTASSLFDRLLDRLAAGAGEGVGEAFFLPAGSRRCDAVGGIWSSRGTPMATSASEMSCGFSSTPRNGSVLFNRFHAEAMVKS